MVKGSFLEEQPTIVKPITAKKRTYLFMKEGI
jgi:hypothetical protein